MIKELYIKGKVNDLMMKKRYKKSKNKNCGSKLKALLFMCKARKEVSDV